MPLPPAVELGFHAIPVICGVRHEGTRSDRIVSFVSFGTADQSPVARARELQAVLRDLAQKEYAIPGSRRRYVAEKTLQGW